MSLSDTIKERIRQAGPVYRTINRVRGSRLHSRELALETKLLGTDYGAWAIPNGMINRQSIVYSVGVGEDVSFDTELVALVGCEVHAFDPTPIAVNWIGNQTLPPEFRFHPLGLAAADGTVDFQLPPIEGWHSYSANPEPRAQVRGTVTCQVRKLTSLMETLGHDHIDLLKMDIEGFEYDVLEQMCDSKVFPELLLVEFHHGLYGISKSKTKTAVRKLHESGYRRFWVSDVGREYGFVQAS